MQPRKNRKADLERQRSTLFFIGLVLSLGAVLLAFNWNTKISAPPTLGSVVVNGDQDFYIPPVTRPEKKELPPPVKEVFDFKLVDNNTETKDDFDFFTSDIRADEPILFDKPFLKQTEEEPEDETVYDWADVMPEFPGGEQALLNYLKNTVVYPVVAQETGTYGKVFVGFIVDADGSVTDVHIIRGVDDSLNNEAIRVVNSMPKWKPGMRAGRYVRVSYIVPINFVLQ